MTRSIERQRQRRAEQAGPEIDLGAARIALARDALRQRRQRREGLDRRREIERAARVGGAVEARRMMRRGERRGEIAGGDRLARVAGARLQPAKAVERLDRRQRAVGIAGDALRSSRRSGAACRRRGRRCARFDHSGSAVVWTSTSQPLPRFSRGDERRAVGQPRPGLAGEIERRLGQHLARHGDVVRHRRARRTGLSASKGARRAGVSQDSAPPSVRPPRRKRHRQQIVVGLVGEMRPGEAQHRAAVLHPFDDARASRSSPAGATSGSASTAMSPLSKVATSPLRTSLKGLSALSR